MGWALLSTVTTPAPAVAVDVCGEPPAGVTTALPFGVSAYAGIDGWLCVLTPDRGTSSVPGDSGPGVVLQLTGDDGGLEVGVTRAGAEGADEALAVQGSDLLVWARSTPGGA